MVGPLNVTREQIAEFCRRNHIRRLSFFGSVLRDDFTPESDVDVLVEYEPGHHPGWEIVGIAEEFSQLVGGRKVDMVNPKYLNRHIKDRILNSAVLEYESPNAA